MTRKKRRLYVLLLCLVGLGTGTALTLTALDDNLAFFQSPSEILEKPALDRNLRLGGLVEVQSVERLADGAGVRFRVTDTKSTVQVVYNGILPDLFREGQGIVAEGRLGPDGVFKAREVLAKHDEKYMPPEVKQALDRAGHPGPAAEGAKR